MPSLAIAAPPPLRDGDLVDLRRCTTRTRLSGWLGQYADATHGTAGGLGAAWVMGPKNVFVPDAALRILPECGGQSNDTGEYFGGAAELFLDVGGAWLSGGLGNRLRMYERAGVRECIFALVESCRIVWRQLERGGYRELEPSPDGWLRSRIFPGLWLDPTAVWNPRKPLRVALDEGLQSAEHAAFVKRLATTRRRGK